MFGGDLNAVNDKNVTPRHLATVSKARFRNEIIHALCLVGAAPCNPRKCNYQCNKPFSADQYPVGKHASRLFFMVSSCFHSSNCVRYFVLHFFFFLELRLFSSDAYFFLRTFTYVCSIRVNERVYVF